MPSAFDIDSIAALRGALGEICSGRTLPRHRQLARLELAQGSPRASSANRSRPSSASPNGRVTEIQDRRRRAVRHPLPGRLQPRSSTTSSRACDHDSAARRQRAARAALRDRRPAPSALRVQQARRRIAARARAEQPPSRADAQAPATASSVATPRRSPRSATRCSSPRPARTSTRPGRAAPTLSNRQASDRRRGECDPELAASARSRARRSATTPLRRICRGWQQSPTPPAIAPGPLPHVPTLALERRRSTCARPISWAERAIAGNPSAQLVTIPNTGHSVIGTDAQRLRAVAGQALPDLRRDRRQVHARPRPAIPIAPRPDGSISAVPTPARNLPRAPRRAAAPRQSATLTAGYLAMRDTIDQLADRRTWTTAPVCYSGAWDVEYDISDDLTDCSRSNLTMPVSRRQQRPGRLRIARA